MVTRREAALAAVVRDLAAATKRWEKAEETDWGELNDIQNDAEAAMEIKAKPARRRAVLRLSQGRVSLSWADKGVDITLHDEDRAETRNWSSSLKKRDTVKCWEPEAPHGIQA